MGREMAGSFGDGTSSAKRLSGRVNS